MLLQQCKEVMMFLSGKVYIYIYIGVVAYGCRPISKISKVSRNTDAVQEWHNHSYDDRCCCCC